MWFYALIVLLVILAIAGATLAGGVFTIVLVPLAAIALISAIVYGMLGRAAERRSGASSDGSHEPGRPLPSQRHRPSGRVQTTPDRLVDSRRQQQ